MYEIPLNRFHKKPAISEFGWLFTPSHKSPPYFCHIHGFRSPKPIRAESHWCPSACLYPILGFVFSYRCPLAMLLVRLRHMSGAQRGYFFLLPKRTSFVEGLLSKVKWWMTFCLVLDWVYHSISCP